MRGLKKLLDENPGLYEGLRHRRKQQANRARVLLDELKESYPVIFNEQKPVPLLVDVIRDVEQRYPDYNQAEIEQALLIWCRKKVYRDSLERTNIRVDLDGMVR